MFKGLGNLTSLMMNAQAMGTKMQEVTAELKNKRATGTAGGGMVSVEVNGAMEVLNCQIEPTLWEQNDREMVEDLLVSATNQALAKARDLHAESLRDAFSEMNLPGMDEAMRRFMGGP